MIDAGAIGESAKQTGIDVNALNKETDAELWGPGVGLSATDGSYKLELDVSRSIRDALLQTFTVTAGVAYTLSFDAYGRRTGSSDFEVWFEGRYIETVRPAGSWRNYQYSFTGSGQQQSIMLREVPAQNDSRGALLDNFRISVGDSRSISDGGGTLSDVRLTAQHSGKCLSVRAGSQSEGARIVQQTCEDKAFQQWTLTTSADGNSYAIRAGHSDQCLDVPAGSQETGARIIQWSCHGGANQLWRLQQSGDQIMIVNVNSGQCLDIANGSRRNGTQVIQWPCHGGPNQLWTLTDGIANAIDPKILISGVIE
jgi:hypothetical protein